MGGGRRGVAGRGPAAWDAAPGRRRFLRAGAAAVAFLSSAPHAAAAAQSDRRSLDVYGSVNVVGQATSSREIRREVVGSLDVFADARLGPFTIHAYVEGSSTPRAGGVSTLLPSANTDAGTALAASGEGRVQLSELRARLSLGEGGAWQAGLMDLTGFLDVSRIANDENLFFLGTPFVNNPTIAFPDYTLGTALDIPVPGVVGTELTLAVSSSHGLADNPEASYAELVAVGEEQKGTFTAGRLRWQGEVWEASVGAWTITGERGVARAGGPPARANGLFTVVEWSSDRSTISGRLGLASPGAPTPESFAGLTYLLAVGDNALGFGVGSMGRSATRSSRRHAEGFLRRRLLGPVYLTASVQWLSGDASGAVVAPGSADVGGTWIGGFRLSAAR